MFTKLFGLARIKSLTLLPLLFCLTALPQLAHAQAIVLSVNGSPITTYDIQQRMKLLRLLRKPASREAAINDLIADQLKLQQVAKFTITFTEADIAAQGARDALEAKIAPAAFAEELQRAGIDQNNWRQHFKAQAEWHMYVKALNKAVDVSEQQVRAEMAKRGESATLTQYLVRQVVIVVPNPAGVEQKMREAQQVRARFANCSAGVPFARAQPDVVVQNLTTRTSVEVAPALRALLDKTPVGHLTAPENSPSGIEMLALCSKKQVRDDTAAGAAARNALISKRLKTAADHLYNKLRATAVIVRR